MISHNVALWDINIALWVIFLFIVTKIFHLRKMTYGKFFFSSNTLAVRTPKIILKLLLKTFSFSSNSDLFNAIKFLILRTLKNARNNAWTSQNHAKSLGVLFSPRRHEQREATLSSQSMVYC